jgi:ABC-type multidrug transport system fused ATPase/permease subunit
LGIFSRGFVAILIFIMLGISNPILALSLIFVLGGTYVAIHRLIKNKLYIIGNRRFQANAEQFKSINEAFGDIKQIKLKGRENFFIKRFSKLSFEVAKTNAANQIMGQAPRYILEVIAFGGVIVVILYLLATGRGFQDFLPLIGLYAFSTYRLIPALQVIFSGVSNIRFNTQSFDELYKDILSFNNKTIIPVIDKNKIKQLSFKKDIKLDDITYSYPETHKPIINNLNITINVNTSIAFVGATGAGKTTIANIILGLLQPDTGKILVDGKEINDENLPYWQRNLGYIPQDIYLQDDTVRRNIAFGITDDETDMDSVINSAKIANIHDFIMEQLPDKYETVIGEKGIRLSGGQRQRIGIARAIYDDPGVLVLDEATSALDVGTENEVFKAIENIAKTKTLIIIAHRLTTIQGCDIIYVLENGTIVGAGKYNDLMKSNKSFRKIAKIHL